RVARADLGRLWLCGLTGVTVNQLLFFNGLAATSPVHASIIMTINPVLVLLISAAVLGTAITARKVLGIALGAAGAITLLLNSGGGGLESHASWQGDLMVLLNAASYGVYLVVVKPLMSKYRPITVISWVFLFGGLMAFPVGASQAAAIEWGAFSTQDWLSVGFVVLFTTFFVYLLNIYALGKVQPTVVSIYIYLQPLLVGAMVWLAAQVGGADYMADMGWLQACCAAVIATGVWLVSVPPGGWARTRG
ncbi:MAG: DMT family transporter, partial [Flavobacteriales bacterium]